MEAENEVTFDLSEIDWQTATSVDIFGEFDLENFPVMFFLRFINIIENACYDERSELECPSRLEFFRTLHDFNFDIG